MKNLATILMLLLALAATRAQAQTLRSTEDYFKRGVARYQQRDLEGALKDFERAIELQTRRAGRADQARQVRVLEPAAAPLYYNRGVARYDLHEWEGALADFDEALKLNPRYVLAWIKRGNLQGALADYNQAIELRPGFALAYFNRSAAYKALGKGFEAEQDFIKSMNLRDAPNLAAEPGIEKVVMTVEDKPPGGAAEIPTLSLCQLTAQAKQYINYLLAIKSYEIRPSPAPDDHHSPAR